MDHIATAAAPMHAEVGALRDPERRAVTRLEVRSGFAVVLTLAFGLPALFLCAHPYLGIYHDGLLYALQALKHFEPEALGGDLYFRYGSQDSLTLFSPLYASLVRLIGLEPAAHLVARTSAACLYAAAWLLARRLMGRDLAWLALALFIVIPGRYGTQHIFSYGEDFATPRPLSESLVLGSLALLLAGRRLAALIAVGTGVLLHPLMALPGLLVGVLAMSSAAARALLIAAGVTAIAVATAIAGLAPIGPLRLLEADWHQVLETLVPYLLMEHWSLTDWQPTVVALVTLAAVVVAVPLGPARRLASGSLMVSAAGLALTAFASSVVPIVLVVQGQPWRWLWLGKAVSVLLLAPLASVLWQRGAAGRGALALLAVAWIGREDPVGVVAALCALLAVFVDCRGSRQWAPVTTWAAGLLAVPLAYAVWSINGLLPETMLAAGIIPAWFAVFRCAHAGPRVIAVVAAATFFGVQAVAAVSGAHRVPALRPSYDDDAYRAFAPWRERIRPDQTVFFPERPEMVWLILHRRSYASYTAVFYSRDVALATRDRLARVRRFYPVSSRHASAGADPLRMPVVTLELLRDACRIPELDFVVTRDELPLPRLPSRAGAPFDALYLYACADARRNVQQ
jgi:hypothetical protein